MIKDISELLKKCRSYDVKSIKVESLGLSIEFYEKGDDNKVKASPKKLSQDQEARLNEVTRIEGVREREIKLSQMDIEDPYAYEQMLLNDSEKEFLNASEEYSRSQ